MRIFIADDHSLFRDGLTSLLKAANMEVIGEANNGDSAVQEILRLKPDLVLMDIHMPVKTGLQALKEIHSQNPDIDVVMLTVSSDNQDLITAIESGARGYLLKNLDSRTFIAHLEGLARGEAAISGEMTSRLITHVAQKSQKKAPTNASTELSTREVEMLQHIARGLSNKAIARELTISENTVKYHIKHILQKLNLNNRAEAVAYAMQNGLIDLSK